MPKQFLQRERHAARLVILQLRHADEDVRVLVGVVRSYAGYMYGLRRDFESRIFLALAQRVGVLELHPGRAPIAGCARSSRNRACTLPADPPVAQALSTKRIRFAPALPIRCAVAPTSLGCV